MSTRFPTPYPPPSLWPSCNPDPLTGPPSCAPLSRRPAGCSQRYRLCMEVRRFQPRFHPISTLFQPYVNAGISITGRRRRKITPKSNSYALRTLTPARNKTPGGLPSNYYQVFALIKAVFALINAVFTLFSRCFHAVLPPSERCFDTILTRFVRPANNVAIFKAAGFVFATVPVHLSPSKPL